MERTYIYLLAHLTEELILLLARLVHYLLIGRRRGEPPPWIRAPSVWRKR